MDLKKIVKVVLLLAFSKGVLASPIYEFSYEYFAPQLAPDYPWLILGGAPPPAIETRFETSAALTKTEFSLFLHATTVGSFFTSEEQQEITFAGSLSNGLFSVESFEFIQLRGTYGNSGFSELPFGGGLISDLAGGQNAGGISAGALPQRSQIISSFQDGSGPLFNFNLDLGSTSMVLMPNYGLQEYVFLNGSEFDLTLEKIVRVSEPPVHLFLIIAMLVIALKTSQIIYKQRLH